MNTDFEIHIEHKMFLRNESKKVKWLEDFLTKNEFSKLWIKVFDMDGHYATILKNSPSRDRIRVLLDNTRTKYSSSTPYEQLLDKLSCSSKSFEEKYFPLRGGTLHNKYILFKMKSKRIEMGYISGSYNLTRSARFKDNDLILFSLKTKNEGYSGLIQSFHKPIEKAFITNYTNLLYDFTTSWQTQSEELKCPDCSSTDIDNSMYCYEMTWKSGHIHLFNVNCKGIFSECDSCEFWCNRSKFKGKVLLKDPEGNLHELFSCGECHAIFTEEGGLIGSMIPYIRLSAKIPIDEDSDDDYEDIHDRKFNKKDIILTWLEDYDI